MCYNQNMSQWNFVKVRLICFMVLVVSLAACNQNSDIGDIIIRAIDKTSAVQTYRSTTHKTTITNDYVRAYSSQYECGGWCTFHSSQIMTETRIGNLSALPLDEDGYLFGDWYLEAGIPITWSESIVVDSHGRSRSSGHPIWGLVLASCAIPADPESSGALYTALWRYRFLVNLEKMSDENISGISCSHYRGNLDFDSYVDEQIEEAGNNTMIWIGEGATEHITWQEQLGIMRRSEATVEFWIDEENYVRQLKIEERSLAITDNGEEWTTEIVVTRYSDFNKSIKIELPSQQAPVYPTPTPTPAPQPT